MRKQKVISFVLIFFAVLTLFVIIVFSLNILSINATSSSSSNLADYDQCIGRTHDLYGMLFPNKKMLTDENCEFIDKYRYDRTNSPECLSLLRCNYSEEEFDREIIRLTEVASEYSEIYFNQPAYILYYNILGDSEYALVNEQNHTIHYISFLGTRFLEQIPDEDRIKPEYSHISIDYKNSDLYY